MKRTTAIISIILILSLCLNGWLIRERQKSDEMIAQAVWHGFNSINAELQVLKSEMEHLDADAEFVQAEFQDSYQKFFSVCWLEIRGIDKLFKARKSVYQDYNLFFLDDYLLGINNRLNSDSLSKTEARQCFDSVENILKRWTAFPWHALGEYYQYDFKKDPENVKEEIQKLKELVATESEKTKVA